MTNHQYESVMTYFSTHNTARQTLLVCNRWITRIVYLIYTATCLSYAYNKDRLFLYLTVTCFVPFVIVSIFRRQLNMPRPYERYGIPSVIPKDTHGQSFPSRHVFSTFVIATTIFFINAPLGIALWIAGIVLAAARVLGGVHFIVDVAAGAAIGVIAGIIGAGIFL
jgi:membrane-associated phospholipid phosphatase